MYKHKYKKPSKYDYDLLVIGSGAAGGVAAQLASSEGKQVGIVEAGEIGGDFCNYSTIPTKALLQAAQTIEIIKSAHQYGIKTTPAGFSYSNVQAWKDTAIRATGVKNQTKVFRAENVEVIKGFGHFIDPWTVSVGLRRYTARKFVIATGSEPLVPNIPGLEKSGYITYKQAVNLKQVPKSVFIIGGGATAYEFAQIFSAFGSKVHIGEKHPHLVPSEDNEVSDCARSSLESLGVRVHCAIKIVSITGKQNRQVVTFEQNGQRHHISCDQIMLAAGNLPNSDLGLENTGVYYNQDGIRTNKYMQTNVEHIMAAGNVTHMHGSSHASTQQAKVAIHNAYHQRKKVAMVYRNVPRVIFGSPEIATVGKTEREMRLTGEVFQTSIAPIGILGKSITTNYSNGFVKIIANHHGVILGASIVSPHASEMIGELCLAVSKYLHACDIANIPQPFPAWAEATRIACSHIKCI